MRTVEYISSVVTLHKTMKPIYNFDNLPQLASRSHWAECLGVDERTLARAESNGLKASKPNGRTVLYSRDAIVGYLTES